LESDARTPGVVRHNPKFLEGVAGKTTPAQKSTPNRQKGRAQVYRGPSKKCESGNAQAESQRPATF